jgi:HK97 gp10 family phage protein
MSFVKINVDMSPVLDWIANAERTSPAVYAVARDVVEETTAEIEELARYLAPEGPTGDLKASIDSKVDGLYGRVFTDLRYAPYVEFGTWKDPVQPFLYPAADAYEDEYPAIMAKRVLPVVKKYIG